MLVAAACSVKINTADCAASALAVIGAKSGQSFTTRKGVPMRLSRQLRRIFRDTVRMYFAPLVGAFKGIRAEYQRIDRDIESSRREEQQQACK